MSAKSDKTERLGYLLFSVILSMLLLVAIATIPGIASVEISQATTPDTNMLVPGQIIEAGRAITTTSYTWEPVILPSGVTSFTVGDLAIHPLDSKTIYLGSFMGLYKSIDAGINWTRLATETLTYATQVTIASQNPQILFTKSFEWMRSENGGETWVSIPAPSDSCSLVDAPSDANRLYALTCSYNKSPAMYRSDDGGQNWILPNDTFTETIREMVVFPNQPDLLLAASNFNILRSADGGYHWVLMQNNVFGTLALNPDPPHMLYIGTYKGILRSSDEGQTWEDSISGQSFFTLLVSPFNTDTLLGGSSAGYWRFFDGGETWSLSAWESPQYLYELIRSDHDDRVVYARNQAGYWRYEAHSQTWPEAIYLPAIRREPLLQDFNSAAQSAVNRANIYREIVEVPPLNIHTAIVEAAQNHADYHMLNHEDPSAWEFGAHGEVEGKPGYTGKWPSDRIVFTGFPWLGGAEVMHFVGDPIRSVDGWMETIYHRVIVLDPSSKYTGYGFGKDGSTAVDVMDFGSGTVYSGSWNPYASSYPLAYPADGQTDVPAQWGGGEYPDPLPPGASRPVGYPFTLQGVGGKLQVDWIQMRTQDGQIVEVHPNPPDCPVFNCYALIAVEPLDLGVTYVVAARGLVDVTPFDRTWTFITAVADQSLESEEPIIGPAQR